MDYSLLETCKLSGVNPQERRANLSGLTPMVLANHFTDLLSRRRHKTRRAVHKAARQQAIQARRNQLYHDRQ